MPYWYFVELRRKTGRPDRMASFECIFEVQGRTRNITSSETDVDLVLRELCSPRVSLVDGRQSYNLLPLQQPLHPVFPHSSQVSYLAVSSSQRAPTEETINADDDAEFVSAFLNGLQRCAISSSIFQTLSKLEECSHSALEDERRMFYCGSSPAERLREELSTLLRR